MIKKSGILFILFLIQSMVLLATHASGGQLTYKPTGNLNEFVVTATHYRDCSGIPAPTSIVLDVGNDCGLINPIIVLPLISTSEISQLCPSALPNSTCNGGILPGMEKYIYQDTVLFSGSCTKWTLGFQICARNSTTNLIGSDCFYVETVFNNLLYPTNRSPIINDPYPVKYVCVNTPVNIPLMISDPDNNMLVFSFISGLHDQGDSVQYVNGYSSASPIPGITLNPNSGQIQFTPTIPGNFVITVLIEELDASGNIIGTVIHDFEVFVDDCFNIPPTPDVTISNFNNFGTNSFIDTNQVISLCTGDQFCFDFTFTDLNLADIVSLSSDIQLNFPGASFNQTGTNPATAQVCMTSLPGNLNNSFSIFAIDNHCPTMGSSSRTFFLSPFQNIGLINNTYYVCPSSNNQLITYNNPNVYWTSLLGDTLSIGTDLSCNPCANPSFYFGSDTSVLAIYDNGNCSVTDTLNIIIGTPNANFAPDTVDICSGTSVTFYAPSPQSYNAWSDGTIGDSLTITPFLPLNLTLTSSNNGCVSSKQIRINVHQSPVPSVIPGQGGLITGQFQSYQWFYNNTAIPGAVNQSHTPYSNGYYQVEVTNSIGCTGISPYFTLTTASVYDMAQEIKVFKIENTINIECPEGNYYCQVYDFSGRLVLETELKYGQNLLQLNAVNQLYLIKIMDVSGKVILSKKL